MRRNLFYHLFLEVFVVMAAVGALFMWALQPVYQSRLQSLVAYSGNALAESILAATSENLYREEFHQVISYVRNSLRASTGVTYVVFAARNGLELVVRGDRWSAENVERQSVPLEDIEPLALPYRLKYVSSVKGEPAYFVLERDVVIHDLNWGVIRIGIDSTEYESLVSSFFHTTLGLTAVMLLVISLVLLRVTQRVRRELSILSLAAEQIESGVLSARAPAGSVSEVATLSESFNCMASSLEFSAQLTRRYVDIIDQTSDGFVLFNEKNAVGLFNKSASRLLQIEPSVISEMSLFAFCHFLGVDIGTAQEMLEQVSVTGRSSLFVDAVVTSGGGGERRYVQIRLESVRQPQFGKCYTLMVVGDITERKLLENELQEAAFSDQLTGLPNMRMLLSELQRNISRGKRQNACFALLLVELDDLKRISDSLGYEIADGLLREFAQRLAAGARKEDFPARLGGERFCLLIQDIEANRTKLAGTVAQNLIADLSAPFRLHGEDLRVNVSIGIALFPSDGDSLSELLKASDLAVRAAQRAGKNVYQFSASTQLAGGGGYV